MACLCCIIFYCTYLFFTCVGRVVGRIHSWSCGGRINFHKFRKHTIGLTIGLVRYVVVWWSRYRRIGNLVVWWSQIGPINDTTNYPRAVIPSCPTIFPPAVVCRLSYGIHAQEMPSSSTVITIHVFMKEVHEL